MKRETLMENLRVAISNVLETMFYQPVQFLDANCTLQEWFSDKPSLFGATLSFSGPSTGLMYLLAPAQIVGEMTANFLGLKEEEINGEQKRDTLKEALNMAGGHMLSLQDKEGHFRIGLPELMDKDDVKDNRLGELEGNVILIETEDDRLAAGIVFD